MRQGRRCPMNLVATPFSEQLPSAQLHWIIADEKSSITVECMADGLHIYDNPVGVLTNNPPFDQQMFMLNNYMNLSPKQPENKFSKDLDFNAYSRGMGALGLPGDLSSASRFAKVAFTKMNSVSGDGEEESVSQFFHILGSVDQQRGCCEVEEGKYEITIYTSCCNATKGIYYYTTYNNHQITAVDMHREKLDGDKLSACIIHKFAVHENKTLQPEGETWYRIICLEAIGRLHRRFCGRRESDTCWLTSIIRWRRMNRQSRTTTCGHGFRACGTTT